MWSSEGFCAVVLSDVLVYQCEYCDTQYSVNFLLNI